MSEKVNESIPLGWNIGRKKDEKSVKIRLILQIRVSTAGFSLQYFV